MPLQLPSIFNCSNDMALAANVRQYIPPKRIQQMENDLSSLSKQWNDTPFAGPWGWSRATKQYYLHHGVEADALPSDEWIDEVRRLSSREYACDYIQSLLHEINDSRLLGKEMTFCQEMPQTVPPYTSIYKSPWSSSGRGVFVSDAFDEKCQKRLTGYLSSQGGFAMDKFHKNKALDFAMEFFVKDDSVDFLGYSVFYAAENGAYGYNIVESQEQLVQRIDTDSTLLHALIDYHKTHLVLTAYRGPVGIDMLKTSDGNIHPCIEINLRMNMGILAILLEKQGYSTGFHHLTEPREHGFEAIVDEGKLMITYKR